MLAHHVACCVAKTLVREAEEIELDVEELEEVIAPGRLKNCNETLVRDAKEIELDVEELEEVIAPGINPQVEADAASGDLDVLNERSDAAEYPG